MGPSHDRRPMGSHSTIALLALLALAPLTSAACASATPEVARQGGVITLAPGDAEHDLYRIDREAWVAAYAQGPSWLISQVQLRPVTHEGRFFGFQILSLFPSRAVGESMALRVGDIIRSVNGRSIERPGHYMELWKANRFATRISVRLMRDHRELEISWAVAGPLKPPSPRAASVSHVPPHPLPSLSRR